MREHFDNYEKKIMKKLDQEAEEIRRAIEGNPEVSDIQADENLDRKVYASITAFEEAAAKRERLEASEIHDRDDAADTDLSHVGLSEKDMEALRLGRELQERKKEKGSRRIAGKWFGVWKRIAAVLVVLVLAGGIGVTSIGGPKQVVKLAKQVVGDRELSGVNRSSEDAKHMDNYEEAQAYQQIKDELGIVPVRVRIITKEMRYKFCEIDTELRTAQLLYEYEGRNVSYLISDAHGEELWIADIEEGYTEKYPYTVGELKTEVIEHDLPESKGKKYTAEFDYGEVHYKLTGTMDWQEFKEILNNLRFPA